MPIGSNRALQVRIADRLRANLARDEVTGLPFVDSLSEADQSELCEMGGGRLAVVAMCVNAEAVSDVARAVEEHVRRTDLLCRADPKTLLLLAPGLDPLAGRALVERLRNLLTQSRYAPVSMGAAFRSPASPIGWTTSELIAEAELCAAEAVMLGSSEATS